MIEIKLKVGKREKYIPSLSGRKTEIIVAPQLVNLTEKSPLLSS